MERPRSAAVLLSAHYGVASERALPVVVRRCRSGGHEPGAGRPAAAHGGGLYGSAEQRSVWRTFALLAVLAAVALPLVRWTAIVDRFSIYLIPLQMFLLARLPYTRAVGGSGSAWRILVVIYTAMVMFVWLNYAVNAHAWLPYGNYLAVQE